MNINKSECQSSSRLQTISENSLPQEQKIVPTQSNRFQTNQSQDLVNLSFLYKKQQFTVNQEWKYAQNDCKNIANDNIFLKNQEETNCINKQLCNNPQSGCKTSKNYIQQQQSKLQIQRSMQDNFDLEMQTQFNSQMRRTNQQLLAKRQQLNEPQNIIEVQQINRQNQIFKIGQTNSESFKGQEIQTLSINLSTPGIITKILQRQNVETQKSLLQNKLQEDRFKKKSSITKQQKSLIQQIKKLFIKLGMSEVAKNIENQALSKQLQVEYKQLKQIQIKDKTCFKSKQNEEMQAKNNRTGQQSLIQGPQKQDLQNNLSIQPNHNLKKHSFSEQYFLRKISQMEDFGKILQFCSSFIQQAQQQQNSLKQFQKQLGKSEGKNMLLSQQKISDHFQLSSDHSQLFSDHSQLFSDSQTVLQKYSQNNRVGLVEDFFCFYFGSKQSQVYPTHRILIYQHESSIKFMKPFNIELPRNLSLKTKKNQQFEGNRKMKKSIIRKQQACKLLSADKKSILYLTDGQGDTIKKDKSLYNQKGKGQRIKALEWIFPGSCFVSVLQKGIMKIFVSSIKKLSNKEREFQRKNQINKEIKSAGLSNQFVYCQVISLLISDDNNCKQQCNKAQQLKINSVIGCARIQLIQRSEDDEEQQKKIKYAKLIYQISPEDQKEVGGLIVVKTIKFTFQFATVDAQVMHEKVIKNPEQIIYKSLGLYKFKRSSKFFCPQNWQKKNKRLSKGQIKGQQQKKIKILNKQIQKHDKQRIKEKNQAIKNYFSQNLIDIERIQPWQINNSQSYCRKLQSDVESMNNLIVDGMDVKDLIANEDLEGFGSLQQIQRFKRKFENISQLLKSKQLQYQEDEIFLRYIQKQFNQCYKIVGLTGLIFPTYDKKTDICSNRTDCCFRREELKLIQWNGNAGSVYKCQANEYINCYKIIQQDVSEGTQLNSFNNPSLFCDSNNCHKCNDSNESNECNESSTDCNVFNEFNDSILTNSPHNHLFTSPHNHLMKSNHTNNKANSYVSDKTGDEAREKLIQSKSYIYVCLTSKTDLLNSYLADQNPNININYYTSKVNSQDQKVNSQDQKINSQDQKINFQNQKINSQSEKINFAQQKYDESNQKDNKNLNRFAQKAQPIIFNRKIIKINFLGSVIQSFPISISSQEINSHKDTQNRQQQFMYLINQPDSLRRMKETKFMQRVDKTKNMRKMNKQKVIRLEQSIDQISKTQKKEDQVNRNKITDFIIYPSQQTIVISTYKNIIYYCMKKKKVQLIIDCTSTAFGINNQPITKLICFDKDKQRLQKIGFIRGKFFQILSIHQEQMKKKLIKKKTSKSIFGTRLSSLPRDFLALMRQIGQQHPEIFNLRMFER